MASEWSGSKRFQNLLWEELAAESLRDEAEIQAEIRERETAEIMAQFDAWREQVAEWMEA